KQIILEAIDFPAPVISVAVEPKTKADQDKMGQALARLSQEDPTFRVHTDTETAQTLISGMGELHLEIIVDRMKREFNVEANVGRPRSEEHTSEVQSLAYLVCRLLLEKKKKGNALINNQMPSPWASISCCFSISAASAGRILPSTRAANALSSDVSDLPLPSFCVWTPS